MAGTHQTQRQVVRFITNGQRANDGYGLAQQVGRIVKRADDARIKAAISTSRRAGPLAKSLITAKYGIAPSQITNRVRARLDHDTLRVDASKLRFPLVLFRGKWGGRSTAGAVASIVITQPRTYAGAFTARGRFRGTTMPLIYTRQRGRKKLMKSGRYAGKVREPIVVNRGPSTYDMVAGFLRDEGGTGEIVGRSGNTQGTLRGQLIAYFVGEYRRLYSIGANRG
jgi:hypothetical protein